MSKFKKWIIWLILNRKERDLLISITQLTKDYAIEYYSMGMGETYKEFTIELVKFDKLCSKK